MKKIITAILIPVLTMLFLCSGTGTIYAGDCEKGLARCELFALASAHPITYSALCLIGYALCKAYL